MDSLPRVVVGWLLTKVCDRSVELLERGVLFVSMKIVKIVSGTVLAGALCLSSTAAAAAAGSKASKPAPAAFAPVSINPFLALSAYGTVQSQEAVRPVVQAPPPVAVGAAPVAAVPAGAGFGFGIGALVAGLIAVAGLAAVVISSKDDGELPISPD